MLFKDFFFKIESNKNFKKDEVKLSHSMEVLKNQNEALRCQFKKYKFSLQLPVIHIICRSLYQGEKLEFLYIKTEFGKS